MTDVCYQKTGPTDTSHVLSNKHKSCDCWPNHWACINRSRLPINWPVTLSFYKPSMKRLGQICYLKARNKSILEDLKEHEFYSILPSVKSFVLVSMLIGVVQYSIIDKLSFSFSIHCFVICFWWFSKILGGLRISNFHLSVFGISLAHCWYVWSNFRSNCTKK